MQLKWIIIALVILSLLLIIFPSSTPVQRGGAIEQVAYKINKDLTVYTNADYINNPDIIKIQSPRTRYTVNRETFSINAGGPNDEDRIFTFSMPPQNEADTAKLIARLWLFPNNKALQTTINNRLKGARIERVTSEMPSMVDRKMVPGASKSEIIPDIMPLIENNPNPYRLLVAKANKQSTYVYAAWPKQLKQGSRGRIWYEDGQTSSSSGLLVDEPNVQMRLDEIKDKSSTYACSKADEIVDYLTTLFYLSTEKGKSMNFKVSGCPLLSY